MIDLRKNLSNIPGWRTDRKIIVIESDDWGSVRTHSKDAYRNMLYQGLELQRSNFTQFDALESNKDLENLFELLSGHRDKTGRHPVLTPMCILANPDFDKIRESGFQEYHYESFVETCKRYPGHDRVGELWKEGVEKRLFVPQMHGREHLNVQRWMKALESGNEALRIAFNNYSFGVSWFNGKKLPLYLAAFDPESMDDVSKFEDIIKDGADLFSKICNYNPSVFIASNSSEPKSLEYVLNEIGIEYLTRYKIQKYPKGNGKFFTEFNWLGKRSAFNQIYLTRNSGFEPSDSSINDWVSSCLKDIEIAFKWKKPAIISTHRVNYIGFIDSKNAERGLRELDSLFEKILKYWPETEFMTSSELGELIKYSNKNEEITPNWN